MTTAEDSGAFGVVVGATVLVVATAGVLSLLADLPARRGCASDSTVFLVQALHEDVGVRLVDHRYDAVDGIAVLLHSV